MPATWNDELLTGNEEIDEQHRELFRKLDSLSQACKIKQGQDEIGRLLWYLKRYVRKHFSSEEKLQQSLGFPGYEAHKAQHEEFFNDVRQLEQQYALEGGSTLVIVKAVQLMGNWLRNHIQQMDMEMAAFVRKLAPKK